MFSRTYARIVKEDISYTGQHCSALMSITPQLLYEFVSNFGNVDHRNCNNHVQKCHRSDFQKTVVEFKTSDQI